MSFHLIKALTPDHALACGLDLLTHVGVRSNSRNGPVLQAPGPVVTQYDNPRARVSLAALRDANPFFHVFEAVWMLAGCSDVASVAAYAARMKEFSDDGENLWGAYGWRWRSFFGFDQLEVIIDMLRRDPSTRRAVLTMWAPNGDLVPTAQGTGVGKDIPCNTQVYFDATRGKLDMTVTNRSNDIVWGAYGANVVHMSYLHEFVAAMTQLPLGTYYQFSNNYHAYVERPDVQRLIADRATELHKYSVMTANRPAFDDPLPLEAVYADLRAFAAGESPGRTFQVKFLEHTAKPMMMAHAAYKAGAADEAQTAIKHVADPAWQYAARLWLLRRGGAVK